MIAELIDNLVGLISPASQLRRVVARADVARVQAASSDHKSMRELLGGNVGGYQAGKNNRLTRQTSGIVHENDVDRAQIERLVERSWNLYRNNPQARKMVRTLQAKVIGRGLNPQPQATLEDGQPFFEFRKRARDIWKAAAKEIDFRGRPGRGGHTLATLSKTALKQNILSGGVLCRFRELTTEQQQRRGLLLPLQIQLLHVDRIDTQVHDGDRKLYGIELDSQDRPRWYYIKAPSAPRGYLRLPAREVVHLFAEEDIDQLIGTAWMAAALITMDDRRDYESSELTAAHFGSCLVAGYRLSSGQTQFGLPSPDGTQDLTDAEGNKVTGLQPGMMINLGSTGEVQFLNSQRPNNMAGEFLGYLQRGEAVSVPGVKSSTLTGDYRQSSFSSERSADNDVWPEIEELQEWFADGFCQPIYERVIESAVAVGMFDDLDGFSVEDFVARRRTYLANHWQGPVPRSINPKDDEAAARGRIQNGVSSPQRECARLGRDWREVMQEVAEFIQYAQEQNVPADIWQQTLGIAQADANREPSPSEAELDAQSAALRVHA